MTKTFAAVDLGAQSGRVAVGRFDGQRLVVEEKHRFPNVPVMTNGILEWDATRLRADVKVGLRKAARDTPVDSVAVDSWAVDFGLLDGAGRLIRNPVHYRDRRRLRASESVLDQIPSRELYERTGVQVLPINTLFELSAMVSEGDTALARARRMLMIPDLFNHWLCGSETTEHTNATTTQCLDRHSGDWARDLLDRLAIPMELLPNVVLPGTPLGVVDSAAAVEIGLQKTTVIATATHDTAAAVAAVPLRGDRAVFLSVGTWSLVGVESDTPIVSDASFRANLTNEGGVDGTFRVLRHLTGLWLLHECRQVWAAAGRLYEFTELVEIARSAPPHRSLIDPNAPLFTEPGDIPARITSFCQDTGQETPRNDGEFVRCILESLALKHADSVELLSWATGRELEELHIVGGGANNDLLCAWTAEAAERPVLVGPTEATLIGNILVQALALGEIASLSEGRQLVRHSFPGETYEPTGDSRWNEARERFAEISRSPHTFGLCA